MVLYDTINKFWSDFSDKHDKYQFDRWVIVKFQHTTDEAYQSLKAEKKDILGFQPLLLTLADPFARESKEVIIKNIDSKTSQQFIQQYKNRFVGQYDNRFGLFRADKYKADAIHDTWPEYVENWVRQGDSFRLPLNVPLLFDHVSDLEYWAWQQKEFDPVGNQRLIITVFQPRTNRFADIFINNISDGTMESVKMYITSQISLHRDRLLS